MSTDRINYVGSALAALDQALNTEAMLSRNDAAARAQAFALLAIADELRQSRGVTLTPAEAALARRAVLFVAQKSQEGPELYALAARLEAAP